MSAAIAVDHREHETIHRLSATKQRRPNRFYNDPNLELRATFGKRTHYSENSTDAMNIQRVSCEAASIGWPKASSYFGQESGSAAAERSAAGTGHPITLNICRGDRNLHKCLCHRAVPVLKVASEWLRVTLGQIPHRLHNLKLHTIISILTGAHQFLTIGTYLKFIFSVAIFHFVAHLDSAIRAPLAGLYWSRKRSSSISTSHLQRAVNRQLVSARVTRRTCVRTTW